MATNVAWSGAERRASADQTARKEIESGSMAQALAGAGAIVLAILGLIGVIPEALAAIAAIALGGGLLVGSAAVLARWQRAMHSMEPTWAHHEIVGGLGMEAFASIAAIVLGIIALLGVNPMTLLSCTAIILGVGMILASGSLTRLEEYGHRFDEPAHHGGDGLYLSSGTDVLVGGGAVVLGIIGLAGHDPITLSLVALISLGTAAMLSGSSLAARMLSRLG